MNMNVPTNEKLLQELRDLTMLWEGIVRNKLASSQDRHIYKVPWNDQLRLLTLRTWSLKYHLPVEEILKVLIGYWSKRFERGNKKGKKGLGCKIGTLCGDVSESILKTYIQKQYPGGENVTAWKIDKQARILRTTEMRQFYSKTIQTFMKRYQQTTAKARKQTVVALSKGNLTRRRYPGNPWI